VAFDNSGNRLITGGLDGTARVWEAGPWSPRAWEDDTERGRLIRLARSQSPERSQYVFGFNRDEVLERLAALPDALASDDRAGLIDSIVHQGLYVRSGERFQFDAGIRCAAGGFVVPNQFDRHRRDGRCAASDSDVDRADSIAAGAPAFVAI
jgi:hypothetical protein